MSDRERYWRRVLADWRGSGLSRAAYCRQRGISYATLNFWKSRIEGSAVGGRTTAARRRRQAKPGSVSQSRFVELAVATGAGAVASVAADSAGAGYEIVLAGGRRLRVPRGFDVDEVTRLLALVSSC
jgi:hypothetical protein